ncbi:MAG: phosphate/phosphite/phosphonate ABC transporter substrate-binding protein [Thermodesulfovibrionales bacterium]
MYSGMPTLFLIICFLLSILTGCTKTETTPPKKVSQEKVLVIGVVPEQNIFEEMHRYEPLADYLSDKVGAKIKLKALTQYGNVIDNFFSLGLDGAFFGSFTYALAHSKLGLEVLARPEYIDGISTYHGLLFVRKDSGIRTGKDMRGKKFAFVDKATTAGYLHPLAYFEKHGIKNYKTYLSETYFAGTHGDAINDVLNKRADIGAAKNTVFERMAQTDNRIKNELIILDMSPDVPENGLAVRKDLDDSVKKKLKDVLLNMHNDPNGRSVLKNFGAGRFIETTDKDYDPVYKYAKDIGLNLANYDYANK